MSQLLQSVENALKILELFTPQKRELGLTEISRHLNIGKSTAHRLLSTLESREFVEQNQENGRYRLGIRTVVISSNKLNSMSIIDECHPILMQLSHASGESAHLSFYSNGHITFVDKVMGANPAVMSSLIGYRLPAHVSASGKVFLAHIEKEELDRFLQLSDLPRLTPYSITNKNELLEKINYTKTSGHGEDQQESDEGLVCFAAPIFDHYNKIVAAMSVSGAASRMNNKKDEMITLIKQYAGLASQKCGFQSPKLL